MVNLEAGGWEKNVSSQNSLTSAFKCLSWPSHFNGDSRRTALASPYAVTLIKKNWSLSSKYFTVIVWDKENSFLLNSVAKFSVSRAHYTETRKKKKYRNRSTQINYEIWPPSLWRSQPLPNWHRITRESALTRHCNTPVLRVVVKAFRWDCFEDPVNRWTPKRARRV